MPKRRLGTPPDFRVSGAGTASLAMRIAAAKSRCRSLSSPMIAAPVGDNGVGALRLGEEHRPFRHVVVPFDQGRLGPTAGNGSRIESPDRIGDLMPMILDQDRPSVVIRVLGMAAEMDLAHMLDRKRIDI